MRFIGVALIFLSILLINKLLTIPEKKEDYFYGNLRGIMGLVIVLIFGLLLLIDPKIVCNND